MLTCADVESSQPTDPEQVIVVGGGPAGCAAAHALAQAGLQVLVLERGEARRDKACGDMFLPSAVAVLNRLGLTESSLLAIGGTTTHQIEFIGRSRRLWKMRYPENPVWMLSRRLLDQALREALPSNVRVVYDAPVTEIANPASAALRVIVRRSPTKSTTFHCRAAVLACGAASSLSSHFGISGSPLLAPAISAYVQNQHLEFPAFEFAADCRPGYRWLFPMGQGEANVGVCWLTRTQGSKVKASGAALLRDHGFGPALRWRGGLGALWSGLGNRWHHPDGMVSCGDAAGLVNPLNGEGLTAALTSGGAAGAAIANYLLHDRAIDWVVAFSRWMKEFHDSAYASTSVGAAWKQLCGWHQP
jgi:geranylgeranyl reductase family protein